MAKLTDRCNLWEHQLISFGCQNIIADIDHYLAKLGVLGRGQRLSAFLGPALKCQVIYRLSYYFYICVRCVVGHLISTFDYSVLRNDVPEHSIVASSPSLDTRLKRRLVERLKH